MGTLKVKILADAADTMERVTSWYRLNMGRSAAQHFVDSVVETIDLLSKMPTIGVLDRNLSTPRRKYYSFLSHPKYRIVYRFTKRTLYIVAIRATLMGS